MSKKYTVSYLSDNRRKYKRTSTVPFLRMSGKWLEEIGMPIGTKLTAKIEYGKIILTKEVT